MATALSMARMTFMAYNLGMGGAARGRSSSLFGTSSSWGRYNAPSYFNAKSVRQYDATREESDPYRKVSLDADTGEAADRRAKGEGDTKGGLYGFSGRNLSRLSSYSMTGSLLNLYV